MSIRPQIPAIEGVKDSRVATILSYIKGSLEAITGRTPNRPQIKTLGDDATYGGIILKVNEIINRLQETDTSGVGLPKPSGAIPVFETPFAWTPVPSFVTPGDFAASSTWAAIGVGVKIGKLVILSYDIVFAAASFIYTTAAGDFQITGTPYSSGFTSGTLFHGQGPVRGYTNANYTWVSPFITGGGSSTILLRGSGSGVAGGNLAAGDLPTGGTVTLRGTIPYISA